MMEKINSNSLDMKLAHINDILEHARVAKGITHVGLLQRTLEHIEKKSKELLEMHQEK